MTQPNLLILMFDQATGTLFPDGPEAWLHMPNLRRLAERSARFDACYTASPLCTPARGGFMTGRLPSSTGIYDNAALFPADMPTFAHHLRRAGYQTALSGKMHFCGPDQLHGFEERLTTDIYPADFGWTPDYRKPGERIDWWYHNMGSVTGSGVAETSNQMEFDDDVAYQARRKLYDLARGKDGRPWCLTVSFTHPHDPYVARRRYWDLYEGCEHLMPEVASIPYDDHDPHSKRIFDANDWRNFDITDDDIARSRRAYFANLSYLDEQVGDLLDTLERTRQEAVIVFTGDHGDMLGEKGLWFKMSFFEGSSRVPLMIAGEGIAPGRVSTPASLIDIAPTLCDIAGLDMESVRPWVQGDSLLPAIADDTALADRFVPMEYAAEASYAPLVSLRRGTWKYNRCPLDPEQLFDLSSDPHEMRNRAADPAAADVLAEFRAEADRRWDLERFDADVRASQARRWVVYDALRQGRYTPWDHQPARDASQQFMRNHMDLNVVEEDKRFPRGE
ncbi:choline-sulfatase [Marivibrio halodurans]|uniref:Choline-sulfatase n=1 Tax=Marivibrio halodurans TaxID=2039722 RepID=A0A8J7SL25_9PROT|nr:choline-sulfatase [Marivibrio halodurans]MBP5855906.1 choline-sulfatase [Marivibrio halodurans]